MTLPPHFSGDLAELPTNAFGHRSLTWWGVIAFMVIEGTFFALAIAAYFYLMSRTQHWPPGSNPAPDLLAGTLFTIMMLVSEIPNTIIKKAAETKQLGMVRIGLVLMVLIGVLLFVLRGFEFTSLNVGWGENAYGSTLWMLLVLHTAHVLTDWADTSVLAALMFTKHAAEPRRYTDVSENSLYWRFVWLTWLPIYLMIYWLPRWIG